MSHPIIIILACFVTIFIGQTFKFFTHYFKTGKFSTRILVRSGGMPSTHTSCVTTLAALIGLFEGPNTFYFAISVALALIVTYDAMGVRLEASKHAVILNRIVRDMRSLNTEYENDKELKELLGHTPNEVICGFILGIVVSIITFLIFR
ncbi:MAG: divergent PAP2 family protein [Erysipelotrichales bacterium]|nr:divergent PAP2 family protein [Erysipelotrichales bacterium]